MKPRGYVGFNLIANMRAALGVDRPCRHDPEGVRHGERGAGLHRPPKNHQRLHRSVCSPYLAITGDRRGRRVGMGSLPGNISVEIEAIVLVQIAKGVNRILVPSDYNDG